jgi:hypothetical protein
MNERNVTHNSLHRHIVTVRYETLQTAFVTQRQDYGWQGAQRFSDSTIQRFNDLTSL